MALNYKCDNCDRLILPSQNVHESVKLALTATTDEAGTDNSKTWGHLCDNCYGGIVKSISE